MSKRIYKTWESMVSRCSQSAHIKNASYLNCSVCEDWLSFTKFREFVESFDGWENKELDKDLRSFGNTVYSPETCMMVHKEINRFVIGCRHGISSFNKRKGKFLARVSNPLTKKREFLGYFDSKDDCLKVWKLRKVEIGRQLCETLNSRDITKYLIAFIEGVKFND